MTNFQKLKNNLNKGFTMAEMLVVIAIIGIMTFLVVYQYQRFNSLIFLNNTAYELATTIQQSQVFGMAHRTAVGSEVGIDNHYGVYVNLNEGTGSRKHYILFIDRGTLSGDPPNKICDGAGGSGSCFSCGIETECLEKSNAMVRDIEFDFICVSSDNEPLDSGGQCEGNETERATVTFIRPNPDAIVFDVENPANSPQSIAFVLRNASGSRRAVIVRSTGQISVQVIPDEN